MTDLQKLTQIADDLKIGSYARHVFLCVGDSCCTRETGEAAWTALKDLLKAKNLSLSTGPTACYRSKVGCLRVCTGGPIMVVYPEGTWYAGMNADRMQRFVESHIERGEPISEWIFAKNPLGQPIPEDESASERRRLEN